MVPSDAVLASMAEQAQPGLPIPRSGVERALPPIFTISPDPTFGTTDRYKSAVPVIRPEDLRESFKHSK